MSSNNPEVIRLTSELRRHELSSKVLDDKSKRKELEIKHLEDELKRHQVELSTLQVELDKENAGIESIKSQIKVAEEKAKIEEIAKKAQAHK